MKIVTKKNHVLALLFWVLPFVIYCQIKFTHYKTEDGLPHDFTYMIHQDIDGYLWVGTDDGLAKFNGTDFKTFDQRDGFRSNFIIDSKNYTKDTLAIGTWKGGLQFMTNDSIISPAIKEDSVSKINRIQILGKDIFASEYYYHTYYKNEGTLKFKKKSLRLFKNSSGDIEIGEKTISKTYLQSTSQLINDTLYFYQGLPYQDFSEERNLKGIYRFTEDNTLEPVFTFLKDKNVNTFGRYDSDTLYAAIEDRIYIFNSDSIIKQLDFNFEANKIHRFGKTSYCEIFVVRDDTSNNERIYIHDLNKDSWEDLTRTLNNNIIISDVFVDIDENVWITSKADGLYKVSKDANNIAQSLLENEDITDILLGNDEDVFFLTVNKIIAYNKKTNTTSKYLLDSSVRNFSSDYILNEKIYVNNLQFDREIGRFNEYFVLESQKLFYHYKNKLFKYDRQYISSVNDEAYPKFDINITDQIKLGIINSIEVVNNELWVATNKGILIYDITTFEFKRKIDQNIGLKNLNIYTIKYSKGNGIWIVNSNGLSLIKKDNTILSFYSNEEMPSNKINDILVDHRDHLWVATQKGFSLYKNGMFYNFGTNKEIQSSFITNIREDNNNQIWISGNKGVVRINNLEPFKPVSPPKLLIKKKDLQFKIETIDFSEKNLINQYRSNANESWINLGTKQIDVQNYAVGNYNLQFRSRNQMSDWVYSKLFHIAIKDKWYKSIWFIVVVFVMGTLLVSLITYSQIKKVSKKNKLLNDTIIQSKTLQKELNTVRENIARDFHDDLGNKLARITVLSNLLQRKTESKDPKIQKSLQQIKLDSNDLYQGTRDFMWSLKTDSDYLEELVTYLSDFGENYLSEMDIQFEIIKQLDKNIKLPYYWSRQLILIFKEAITNAVKHSGCSVITISFVLEKEVLEIKLQDNGTGFETDVVTKKNGLHHIQKRAKDIGGILFAESGKNGTSIRFIGKLP